MNDIVIVAAFSTNYVIGKGLDIPWRNKDLYPGGKLPDDLREDMKRFRIMTTGNTVIMGRRTLESMGYKALPNRENIVVSNTLDQAYEGITVAHSIDEAINMAKGTAFLIGGTRIYEEGLKVANRMELTRINGNWDGDAYFPRFDVSRWKPPRTVDLDVLTFESYERAS